MRSSRGAAARSAEMKYSIKHEGSDLNITVQQLGDKQAALMEELKACAEGRCSCPTPQYSKLQAIDIKPGTDKVEIALKPKPGEKIEQADIAKCLDHTAKKLGHPTSKG